MSPKDVVKLLTSWMSSPALDEEEREALRLAISAIVELCQLEMLDDYRCHPALRVRRDRDGICTATMVAHRKDYGATEAARRVDRHRPDHDEPCE